MSRTKHSSARSRVFFGLLGIATLLSVRQASATGPTTAIVPVGNVETCSTVKFTYWSLSSGTLTNLDAWGSIDASGLYTAPTIAQGHPTVDVSFVSGAPGKTSLPLGTAFPSAASPVVPGATSGTSYNIPYEHAFSANGARVYTAVIGPASSSGYSASVNVFASSDGGVTFGHTPTSVPMGTPTCATIAADAGDPNTAYLVSFASHTSNGSNSGTTARVAVSRDGGVTFPLAQTYVIADSNNLMATMICPDVISPSPGHVVATAIVSGPPGMSVALWSSGNYGSYLGPVAPALNSTVISIPGPTGIAPSNTQNAPYFSPGYLSNNSYDGPRLFTNGAGTVCVGYDTIPVNNGPSSLYVQCSQDSGATWTGQKIISAPPNQNDHNPVFGAVSPTGKVAITFLTNWTPTTRDTMVAIYPDATLSARPRLLMYPTASRTSIVATSAPSRPVVAWKGDSLLWFAQTLNYNNAPVLLVDKICDPLGAGTTWSGPVSLGHYIGTSLISTTRGMVAGAYLPGISNGTIGLEYKVVH